MLLEVVEEKQLVQNFKVNMNWQERVHKYVCAKRCTIFCRFLILMGDNCISCQQITEFIIVLYHWYNNKFNRAISIKTNS